MRFLESTIKSTQDEGITPRKLDQISKEQFFSMANPRRQPEDSYSQDEENVWSKYWVFRRNGRNLSMLQTALALNDLQFLKIFNGDLDLQKLFSFYILSEEACLSVVEAIKDRLDLDRAIKEVDIRCNFYFWTTINLFYIDNCTHGNCQQPWTRIEREDWEHKFCEAHWQTGVPPFVILLTTQLSFCLQHNFEHGNECPYAQSNIIQLTTKMSFILIFGFE